MKSNCRDSWFIVLNLSASYKGKLLLLLELAGTLKAQKQAC